MHGVGSRLCWMIFLILVSLGIATGAKKSVEDDFDEFDFEFELPENGEGEEEEEQETGDSNTVKATQGEKGDEDDKDGTIENEFDDEEFESGTEVKKEKFLQPDLELKESTVRIKPLWEAYFVEVCIILGILLYLSNYLMGRIKNTSLAEGWMVLNMPALQNDFVVVGDDGEGEEPNQGRIVKRTDNSFTVWCSGRANCDSLLVHIELIKRHDLFSIITNIFRPTFDTVSFIFELSEKDMDNIVLAVSPRKAANKLNKEYADLNSYCTGIRSGEKHGLPNTLSVLSETFECASAVLSGGVTKFLSSYAESLVCLHISDQYTGLKEDTEESDTVVIKKGERRIHLTFKMSTKAEDSTNQVVFAMKLLDHVKGIRLSREAKEKAHKNRQKVAQEQEKLQHQQRQEAAQQRREEKKKAEKEKMLNETDVDKTRKWEDKEHKKQMKKGQPKMKQMKIRMG